jgi:hypothetical protein
MPLPTDVISAAQRGQRIGSDKKYALQSAESIVLLLDMAAILFLLSGESNGHADFQKC